MVVRSACENASPDGPGVVRPPPRPLRVLDPRRGVPHPAPRCARSGAGDAGGRAHRPRLARRRCPAHQGGGQAGREAGDRLRGLRRRRPALAAEGLRPPDPPGRVQRGLREPDQALVARLPRGLLLQAARRLGAARAPREGPRRALGLPLGPRLQGARGEPAARRRGRPRPARADDRPRQRLRRAPERAPRRPAADQPAPARARGEDEAAAGRDRRRPLPRCLRRRLARGAPLHPVGRLAEEPEPLALRDERVLLQDPRGDGARLPRPGGGDAPHARGRRALHRRDRAGADPPPDLPDARRPRRVRVPRRALREGARAALRDGHARAPGPPALRAEDDPRDGLRGLLPDRPGLRRLREAERRRRRPGPRLGGRLDRRLLARDHRPRPDPLRAPLRALPQPGPEVDARHRHRLRRRGPRARHQLRGREVRPRPGRADHHLRDDGRPRRRARRRARARDPVRRRRQDREADPGRAGADARRVPQARGRAEDRLRGRPGREGDRRPGEAARGPRAPGLDPRRRRRHRRGAADEPDPAAAEGRRPGGRDAVRDERRRGARAPEDGLPRAAEPRRDRHGGRARRRRARHLDDRDGRPQDVRDARARRGDRRLPVRVVGDARGAAAGEADRVRGPDRARRPLPAGADGVHPGVRAPQARPGGGHLPRPAPEAADAGLVRDLHLPGAVHADRQGDRRLHARRGRRPAQGDRQEDPRADGVPQGQVPRGLRRRTASPRASRPSSGRTWSRRRTTRSTSPTPPATR